jgi:predicted nucleic acid-binding protein
MTLADTNLVIYAAGTTYPKVRAWVAAEQPAVSSATRVEALGYHKLTTASEADLLAVVSRLAVLPIMTAVEDQAIRLRRQRSMKLGDALIAATALVHGFDLATRNLKDFAWIPGLTVFDPS